MTRATTEASEAREGAAPSGTGTGTPGDARWEALGWDHPAAARLRDAMDADLAPRYAALWAERARLRAAAAPGGLTTAPAAAEVLVAWVAFDGGEPVATAALRRLGDTGVHEVKRLFVVPSYRGRGLAVAALDVVERSARERGLARLRLQTGVRQPEAVALYERQGWRRIETYPPYPRESSICFEKDL